MGNSGFMKLMFADSYVETHYKSIYDIPLVNIEKQEQTLKECQGKKTLIVNVASNAPNLEEQFKKLSKSPYNVVLFPTNQFKNEPNNYAQIAEKFKGFKVFQKIEINGRYTHPIYKYLKRNTPALYNESISNGKRIREDFCKFLISEDGQILKFYRANDEI